MRIFGFNIQVSRESRMAGGSFPQPKQKCANVTPEEWLRGEDIGLGTGMSNAYQQVVWVYRAINALAEQVANVPFLLSAGERGRESLVTSGPLLDFYAQPHPQIDRFQYWELRVMWLMLRGECARVPIYAEGPRGSRPLRRVLILDPSRFAHIIEGNQLIG